MWRNSHRTVIVMCSIAFAVILSIFTSSLKTGVFDNLIKNMVSYYSGYIQIHKKGYWDERILDNSFPINGKVEQTILSDRRIFELSPRIESFALASAGEITKGCMVLGIDPTREDKITFLRAKVTSGKYISSERGSVMIAEGLLKRLGLQLNDTIVLIGQGYHGTMAAGKYRITALLKFGSPDLNDKMLVMALEDAQKMYAAEGMITSYVLSIQQLNELNSIKNFIQKNIGPVFEVMTWEELMPDIEQHIKGDSANMQIVQIILYLLISFGIFSMLLVMMEERKFEMGMLVAIGMRKLSLAAVVMIESVLTVLLGCTLGIAAAIPIVLYFKKHPMRFTGETARAYERFGFEPIFPASAHPKHFIEQAIIVLCIGLLLSLYPVYKSLTLNTMKAMRK